MGQLIILMGPTGAGKTMQGRFLAEQGWSHISSGELLRDDDAEAAVLARGELAPSSDVERLVDRAVGGVKGDQPVVLDGFPRTVDEAEWLDSRLPDWGRTLTTVILLDVSDATIDARLASRRRNDDTTEALQEKQTEYREITQPLIDVYESRGLLHRLDGEASAETVSGELIEVLGS